MGAPLRIVLVGPLPPPSAGMANQTQQLARLLSEAGIEVGVVRMNEPYRPAWVERVPFVRAAFRLVPYKWRLWREIGQADLVHLMASSGWAWHLFAAPAIWIAWLRGKPIVVNYRGGGAEDFFRRSFGIVRPTLKRASVVVVPSRFLREVFGRRGVETEIVPNIIDLSRFRPQAGRSSGMHVVVARNLEDLYDMPTALRAFRRILDRFPQARLSMAGSGSRRQALEQLCAELSIDRAVTFTGRLDNARMTELYRDADLMINPSLADNMPISLLEAMASGVPIVSTDVGGIPYMVREGETALLVPTKDPDAMARAALAVLSDSALADRMRNAALADIRQYTWAEVRKRLFGVYGNAVGRTDFEFNLEEPRS